MKNILIITAHPSSTGFTHAIAEAYQEEKQIQGHNVEIIDLYTTDLQQAFFSFDDIKKKELDPIQIQRHEKISGANELVFVYPIWRGDCPAILKNWLDCNLSAGFAFKYTDKFPVGLLKDKTAKVFCTCDAPGILYKIFPISFKRYWSMFRLGFCGIKIKQFVIFDMIRQRKKYPQKIEKLLQKVRSIARK